MEGFLIVVGFMAAVFWTGLTIAAFFQVGWLHSILMIALTAGVLFFINSLCTKADNQRKKEKAKTVSKIAIGVSAAMIIIGFLMFIFCFLLGPTGYVDTFTKCGWCGGAGTTSNGQICKLCYGGGGASGSSARYTATLSTWLGVLLASAGVAIILGTRSIKKKHYL